MKLKQCLKIEVCDITPENINGYCHIDDDYYKIYQDSNRTMVGFKFGDRYGRVSFVLNCDELIINGELVKDVSTFCIKFMAEHNFTYDEEEGFVK